MFGLVWLPRLDDRHMFTDIMLLTFLNLHMPVLDKKIYIKNCILTELNKPELFKAPAVRQKIAGATNVFSLRPLKGNSRHRARHLLKGDQFRMR